MDTLNAIFSRRSIRRYQSRPVSKEAVETILRAGMAAPSGKKQYIWHFIVIRDTATLHRLADMHEYGKMLRDAPLAIMICADLDGARAPLFYEQDLSATTQNMLLAIHHLGLGSVWLSLHPREQRKEAVRKLLNIPDRIIPYTLLPLGYPAESPDQGPCFKPERIHHEQW